MTRILTPEMVRRFFQYDPVSGGLYWVKRPLSDFKSPWAFKVWNKMYALKRAGAASGHGYRKITVTIDGVTVRDTEHRLVWAYFWGAYPEFTIDHIDGNRSNNRIENLRDVPQDVNNRNSARPKNNATGVVGTSFDKATGRYNAHIYVRGVVKRLGRFDTLAEAAAARKAAEAELDYHPNHGRAAA